jgi:hypothetical protein
MGHSRAHLIFDIGPVTILINPNGQSVDAIHVNEVRNVEFRRVP